MTCKKWNKPGKIYLLLMDLGEVIESCKIPFCYLIARILDPPFRLVNSQIITGIFVLKYPSFCYLLSPLSLSLSLSRADVAKNLSKCNLVSSFIMEFNFSLHQENDLERIFRNCEFFIDSEEQLMLFLHFIGNAQMLQFCKTTTPLRLPCQI